MSKTKTYWKGYSEKHKTPEFVTSSNKEFQENIPVGEFLSSDEATDMKSGRRDFLKFMGFSVAAASLASCEAAVIKSIPYVNKPEEITPGVANWYSSTYYDGNDFANILVKSREGRPIWLKGKRDGYTQGGLIPRISTSILNLYNSSRLEGPISSNNQVSWAEVDKQISSKLSSISKRNGKIRILSNTIISPSTKEVINDFINKYSSINSDEESEVIADIKHIQYDAQSYSGIRTANERNFGKNFIPSYNFDKAKTIVSINADFICNWLLPTKFSTDFSKARKPENGWMSKHFQFESVLSLTGANADYRAQIKPSEELALANAILDALNGNTTSNSFNEDTIGKIQKSADNLIKNRGESLVVAGSNNPNVQLVVNKINHQLGNYGKTIDTDNHLELHRANDQEIEDFKNQLLSGDIDGVIFYGTNPVYSHPEGAAISNAISSLDLSVSFSEFMDETASKCQFTCPDHNYLEAWCDHNPVSGHYSIQQPLIRPLYNSRQAQESLLVWAGKAQRTNSESEVFYNYIKKNWSANNIGNQAEYVDFSDFWNWTLHNGFSNNDTIPEVFSFNDVSISNSSNESQKEWEFVLYQKELGVGNHAANPWLQELPDAISKIVWDNYITMAPSDCYKVFGIDSSNQKSAWDGIHLGQEEKAFVASIKVNEIEMKLPVYPLPGQKSGTVGISLGYGRGENNEDIGKAAYQCDEFGSHLDNGNGGLVPIGSNAFKLCSFKNGYMSYNGFGEISPTDERYSLAGTQTHHTVMGRTSIVKETTFDFWKDNHESNQEAYNPKIKLHSHEEGGHSEKDATEYSLWNEHPVENVGHRWGMSIDLSSCNGCGVCITACHSENNVPVVGKDEVRRARDMHWLRMDRYFSSIEDDNREKWAKSNKVEGEFDYGKLEVPEENPSVVFMPMLCQHCNHAPCETVCPVAATTHSNEGLNMMTYNRCIGTRYCANNCPYKVRRFNWFNYRDYRKFKNINPNQDQMARMVLNPDVVVRSRGVMEKCSFCVQGIQAAKLKAKKEGRKVMDGDVMCACGDACPNDCITFGDWNDPDSKIKEVSNSDRAYQALEEVGVKPNIWYQVKVRNNDDELLASSVSNESHSEHH
jgi:molybdopterin-containing oxidoreductase family iron-sulfur binding subunit